MADGNSVQRMQGKTHRKITADNHETVDIAIVIQGIRRERMEHAGHTLLVTRRTRVYAHLFGRPPLGGLPLHW
jgi:hypothetical protein